MYSLVQSHRIKGNAGEPLPTVFKSLDNAGIRFLRGQYVLIAAGAGTGKSGFVLTQALKSRTPTFYFSADSDAFVQLSRALAITSGMGMERATEIVRSNTLGDHAKTLDGYPMRIEYNASPSLDTLETSVEAYEEVYGQYPDLVIVDNITNVRIGGDGDDDPFSGLEGLNDYLHTMARETGACVVGLHHVTGPYNDAEKPIPLSGVKGQISRVPEMILTLFRPGPGKLGVSAVKNRGGKANPSGEDFVELDFIGDMMKISDPPMAAQIVSEDTTFSDEIDDRMIRELQEVG